MPVVNVPQSLGTLLRSQTQPKGFFVFKRFSKVGIYQLLDIDKKELIQAYKKTCPICDTKFRKQTDLVCHHREYGKGDNVLTMVPICQPCHDEIHAKSKKRQLSARDMTFSDPSWADFKSPDSPEQTRVIAAYYQQLADLLQERAVEMVAIADRYEALESEGIPVDKIHECLYGSSLAQIKRTQKEAAAQPRKLTPKEAELSITEYMKDLAHALKFTDKTASEINKTLLSEEARMRRKLLPS